MQQLMTEYAAGGKVVWVYRHFPLTTVHAYALRHAVAAECTASLGTTESFWRFIDTLHAAAPGASEFNPKGYDDVVKQLGIDVPSFNTCLTSGKFSTLIRTQIHNALEAGATGAPYIVVLVKGQEPVTINGSISYDSMKKVIEKALSQGS
jgi:protein-disulfide isomerase